MAKKILVVDDEPDILKVVVFRLEKAGYKVTAAEDGQKALDSVQREKPDLILLDLRLPVIDGYEVCKRLRSDEAFKKIPIIFLTASTAPTIIEKTKEYKADDYLIKPFEPDDLLKKVEKFVK